MDDIQTKGEIINSDEVMETSIVKVDSELLKKGGYTKLPKEAFERIDFLAQYVPGHVAQKMTIDAANKTISGMTENAFKVVIKDGMHLGKSSTMKGAFKGLLFSNEGNKLKSTAELIPLVPETIPNLATAQVMLGFFNTLSFVTGQYFLSSIHKALINLGKDTDRIIGYLELEKRSSIKAEAETLERALTFISYIMENDIQRQSAASDFKAIKRSSLSKIHFFLEAIDEVTQGLNEKTKSEEVKNILNDLQKYYPQCWYAVRNYCLATALDAIVSGIDDPFYLDSVEGDIRTQICRYKSSVDNTMDAYDTYLDGSSELNKKPVANGSLKEIYESKVIPTGVRFSTAVVDMIDTQRVINSLEKKKRSIDDKTRFLEACDNLVPLNETVKIIREYQKISNNPIEIIVTKDDAYIKCLDIDTDEDRDSKNL